MNLYEGATITTLLLGVIEVAFWVWLVRGVILPLRTINKTEVPKTESEQT